MQRGEICPHGNLESDHPACNNVVIQRVTTVLGLPDPEDKDKILQNAENYSPNNTASQSCGLEYILYKILAGREY